MSRRDGRTIELTDVPSVIAASKCWLARNSFIVLTEQGTYPERKRGEKPRGQRMSHPSECGWCVYPDDVLLAAVEDFLTDGDSPEMIAAFTGMNPENQRKAVLRAQSVQSSVDDPIPAQGQPVRPAQGSRRGGYVPQVATSGT